MGFTLVDELGIEYGSPALGSPSSELRYPVYAARAADGSTIVVDELAIEKSLHLRAWYRTLKLAPDGTVLANSETWGVDDAFGFPFGDALALLRVTQWEILLVSNGGDRIGSVDLSP